MHCLSSTTIPYHCDTCVFPQRQNEQIKEQAVLFLQIDDVLALGHMHPDIQDKIESIAQENLSPGGKGKEEASDFYGVQLSALQIRIAESTLLDVAAVNHLMRLIGKVEEIGKRVGIVIVGSWALDATVQDVCQQMFAKQLFAQHVIGCVVRQGNDNLAESISRWKNIHAIEHFAVILDKHLARDSGCKGLFGDRVISVESGFGNMGEVERAISALME